MSKYVFCITIQIIVAQILTFASLACYIMQWESICVTDSLREFHDALNSRGVIISGGISEYCPH